MLDLFCGRLGWSKAFLARGWECVGVDLVESPLSWDDAIKFQYSCRFNFLKLDVLTLSHGFMRDGHFDFICASSPCEEFSVHGMKHFHPNPKYPENGIKLFNHTREICEASGVPYVMENVRAAQQFVGPAVHHCGPFYLWGTGVPVLMNQGIIKAGGLVTGGWPQSGVDGPTVRRMSPTERAQYRKVHPRIFPEGKLTRKEKVAQVATIPPELANCVADYAERLLEQNRLNQGNPSYAPYAAGEKS